MNYKHFILIQILVIIVPLILSIKFPNISTRYFVYSIIFLSILVFEGYRYTIYREQKDAYSDIQRTVKVKIIAGKFIHGVFNNDAMNKFDYPRITNEASIGYGNTHIPNDLTDQLPYYPLEIQLYDYLFLKFLNHCYHEGWYLIEDKPVQSEHIYRSPKINLEKDNSNEFRYDELPHHVKEYNIFFNNNEIFYDKAYVDKKTIQLLYRGINPRPFKIILPPGVALKIVTKDNGWPDLKYTFVHKLFRIKFQIENLVSGPGYPFGFHLKRDENSEDIQKNILFVEMLLNIRGNFNCTILRETELSDLYRWFKIMLNYFNFYFDYDTFEREIHHKLKLQNASESKILIIKP